MSIHNNSQTMMNSSSMPNDGPGGYSIPANPNIELPSVLNPHHAISTAYPCPRLSRGGETLFLRAPHDAQYRYEPLSVVQDAVVEAHTDLDTTNQNSFYSIVPTDKPSATFRPSLVANPSLGQLVTDMSTIAQGVGSTYLTIWTYRDRSRDSIVKVRIRRATQHRKYRGVQEYSSTVYNGEVEELLAIRSSEQWMRDVQDLVTMTSDRAYKHVFYRLCRLEQRPGFKSHEIVRGLRSHFRQARPILYDEAIRQVTKAVPICDLDNDIQTCICMVCREACDEIQDKAHDAIYLPCNETGAPHLIGRSCLERWCKTQGPAKAACPYCRRSIFPDSVATALKFGTSLTDPKEYVRDPRYSTHDNFERSCADLDKELACNEKTGMEFQGEWLEAQFMQVLDHFLFSSPETVGATPSHLQPQRRPELYILREAIENLILSHRNAAPGCKTTVAWLGKDLEQRLIRHYGAEIVDDDGKAKDWLPFFSELTIAFLKDDGGPKEGMLGSSLPRGLMEFVLKSVSRALRFLVVRGCGRGCDKAKDAEGVWSLHYHGCRLYYITPTGLTQRLDRSVKGWAC